MASAELSRRVEKLVSYPPLSEMSDSSAGSATALLAADPFEDMPGKWQASSLQAEQNRPELRPTGRTLRGGGGGPRGATPTRAPSSAPVRCRSYPCPAVVVDATD
jgi:hypothetical protein